MKGAILGDIIGSRFEHNPLPLPDPLQGRGDVAFDLFTTDCHFTDDTVLTVAIAEAMLEGKDYRETIIDYALRYPDAGYGANFRAWLNGDIPDAEYQSWGNGSAMRVSPVGWLCNDIEQVLAEARNTALPTHGHPEGIKGAQAVAASIFLARQGAGKEDIRHYVQQQFGYRMMRRVENVSCAGSVPEAIICFLDSTDLLDAIRLAVSLGGDADTQAAIAGSIAEAFYGPPPKVVQEVMYAFLPDEFKEVMHRFEAALQVG